MTVGDEPTYFETLDRFTTIIREKDPEGLEFSYTRMEDENHGSIPHLSIYSGLESIYSGWQIPKETFNQGLAAIDKHYQVLSKKYGYEISTPEYTLNFLGYTYMRNDNLEKAIKVFKENVKRYPGSANVYDSLGEAYEKDNQLGQAAKNYEKAVRLGEKNDHPYLKTFKANLERIQQDQAQK